MATPRLCRDRIGIVPAGALGVAFFYHLTDRLQRLDGEVCLHERHDSASSRFLRETGQLLVSALDSEEQTTVDLTRLLKPDFLTQARSEPGALPEVLLVSPNPDQILPILNRLVEYLELIYQSPPPDDTPLPWPMVVLCANGIYYQRVRLFLIEKIEEATLLGRLPDLWPHRMPEIVGRLLRGVTIQTGLREGTGTDTLYRPGPRGITRLAGGEESVRKRCSELLQSRGGWFEPARESSATRLEFDKGLVNLVANLLGQIYAIDDEGAFRKLRIQEILVTEHEPDIRDLARHVFEVGLAVKAYRPNEAFETVYEGMMSNLQGHETHIPSSLQWVDLKIREGSLKPELTPTETWLLEPLIRYARSSDLGPAADFFEQLKGRLVDKLTRAAARCA